MPKKTRVRCQAFCVFGLCLLVEPAWMPCAFSQDSPKSPEEILHGIEGQSKPGVKELFGDPLTRKLYKHSNAYKMMSQGKPWFPGFKGDVTNTLIGMKKIWESDGDSKVNGFLDLSSSKAVPGDLVVVTYKTFQGNKKNKNGPGEEVLLVYAGQGHFPGNKKEHSFFFYPYRFRLECNTIPPRKDLEYIRRMEDHLTTTLKNFFEFTDPDTEHGGIQWMEKGWFFKTIYVEQSGFVHLDKCTVYRATAAILPDENLAAGAKDLLVEILHGIPENEIDLTLKYKVVGDTDKNGNPIEGEIVINKEKFGKIADRIAKDKILIEIEEGDKNSVAVALYRSKDRSVSGQRVHGTMVLFSTIDGKKVSSFGNEKAVIIHESVHAINDMDKLKLVGAHDEAAAYIVQHLYALQNGEPQNYATLAAAREKEAAKAENANENAEVIDKLHQKAATMLLHEQAQEIALKIRKSQDHTLTTDDPMVQELISRILKLKIYGNVPFDGHDLEVRQKDG